MKSFTQVAVLFIFSLSAFALQDYQEPIADAGEDITVRMGARVILKSLSSDPDGDELEHRWSIASMPEGSRATLINPNSESPSFFADREGSYKVHLVVSDGIFISNLDNVVVTVTSNSPPVIVVDSYRTARAGGLISFDASASMDLEMDFLDYRWSLLKTPVGSNAKLQKQESSRAQFAPDKNGLYTLKLWVSDGLLAAQSHIALRVYGDSCEIPKTLEDKHCEGVFEIASESDLNKYLATLGLKYSDSDAKSIRLSSSLSLSGNLSLATPCRITTSENLDLNISGKLCLNAPKAYISSKSRINAGGDLEIKGGGIDLASKVIVSAQSINLYSPGEDQGSAIRIQGDGVINAKSLSMSAHAVASIGSRVRLNIDGGIAIEARGEGDVTLGRESQAQATSLSLKSQGKISMLRGAQIDAWIVEAVASTIESLRGTRIKSGSAYLDADNCIGVDNIAVDSLKKGGRCLADSSLLAMISPLSKQSYFVGEGIAFDIGNSKGYESATINFGDNTTHEFAQDQTQITHSYSAKGIYKAVLTVSRGEESATSSIDLIVTDNIPPEIFDFAFEVNYDRDGYPIKKVEFSAQGKTNDLGGSIAQYEYDFGDGSDLRLSSNPRVRHAYQEWGTYQVSVRVKDNLGAWSAPIARELVLQNQMPVIEFEIPEEVYPYQVIGLNGMNSSDPEGDNLTYEWLIDREHFSSSAVDAHFFEEEGLHHIMLIAKDSKGLRNYITKKIRVVPEPERDLVAKMRVQASRNAQGQILGEIFVDSEGTSIQDGEITRRTWTLYSGGISESSEGGFFSARLDPGVYLLEFEVESANGTIAKTARKLDVAAKYENRELLSPINTTITGYDANAFNPTSLTLNISFDGDGIDLDQEIDMVSGYASVASTITKTNANSISIAMTALDGFNDLYFQAFDKNGYHIRKNIKFLAGSRSITVDVLDSMSNNITTGSFKAIHTPTNTPVTITATNSSNQFVISNAPASDLYLYFLKANGDFIGKRIGPSTTDLDLTLRGFSTVSTTANPDLSQGSAGWTFDSDYVTLVQIDGENRFQIELEQGESTEYSHAFTASQSYLSYPIELKGNIVDAYINVILRNYTQDTVSVRSLSPQDLGYTTQGESFDIFEGYVTLAANTGDELEIIVQISAPPASMKNIINANDYRDHPPRFLLIRNVTTPVLYGSCLLGVELYDLYDVKGQAWAEKLVQSQGGPGFLSLGFYPAREGGNKSTFLYTLADSNPNLCEIQSIVLKKSDGTPVTSNPTPVTIAKSRPNSDSQIKA